MRCLVPDAVVTDVKDLTLEVGCGQSRKHSVRLDFSPGMAANVIGDAANLPFRSGSFRLVCASFLFEHLQNPQAALREWRRVLAANGFVDIVTDNASHWRFHVHFPRWLCIPNTHQDYRGTSDHDKHFALYLPMHLQNHLMAAGFVAIRLNVFNVFPLSRPLEWLGLRSIAAASVRATGRKAAGRDRS